MDDAAKVLKSRENMLRMRATRQGLRLRKCPMRDPHGVGFGRFMIVDEAADKTVLGRSSDGKPWQATIDQVEAYLKGSGR